ncbi:MAG: nucleotidyltransferase family protein [Burkholderiales bacterium]|nr:nucleotidyltransferase family protein [Burkholderiales bacterium]
MLERPDLVIEALTRPAPHFAGWSAAQWTSFFQQARNAGLLGRAGARLRGLWPLDQPPPWPANLEGHLVAAERLMRAQRAEVERELGHIARALAGLGAPVLVLKGAAYLAASLPPGASRVFSDVDILVPRQAIAEAESRLMLHGWAGTHDNAYDQRYYREWMHELPPMQHLHRGTTLDLHHNILPSTARFKPSGEHLVDGAVPLVGRPGLYVLGPADMVLHCMTHLFMNEETSRALRDLSDLDLLLRHFGSSPAFWTQLTQRAALLDLERPLYYGLRHAARVLGTPVPAEVTARAEHRAPVAPTRVLMDAIWHRALRCPHPSAAAAGGALARFALYVRGHWLRMPPWMLARHLTVKALRLHERSATKAVTAPTQG